MNTTLKRFLAIAALPLFMASSLQTTFATFQDLTGSIFNSEHESNATGTTHVFGFTNQVPMVTGDKIQVEFPADFAVHDGGSSLYLGSTNNTIQSFDSTVVDEINRTLTSAVTIDSNSDGIDNVEVDADNVDNPTVDGTYTVTVRLLDSSDAVKDSGTFDVTIAPNMVYLNTSPDNDHISHANTKYYMDFQPNTQIQSGDTFFVRFPASTDISGISVNQTDNPLMYWDFSNPQIFPTIDNEVIDNVNKTYSFRVTAATPSDPGSYVFLELDGITNPTNWGVHNVELQVRDGSNNITNVGSSLFQLASPQSLANDSFDFSVTPTQPLVSGGRIEVALPAGFSIYAGRSYMNVGSYYGIFNSVDNTVVNGPARTMSDTFSLNSSGRTTDSLGIYLNQYLKPSTPGVYPITVNFYNASNALTESIVYDVAVGANMQFANVNLDDSHRVHSNTTYSFQGQPTTNVDNGQKIRIRFPASADITGATIDNMNFTNYTGSPQPTPVINNIDHTVTIPLVTSGDSSGSVISFDILGIKNPREYGNHLAQFEVLSPTDDIIEVAYPNFSLDPPSSSSFNNIEVQSPLTGVKNTMTMQNYPSNTFEAGWKMVMQFPATSDLSDVDPSDVTFANPGFTSPAITVNNTLKQITIIFDGTYDGSGINITINDVRNPTASGDQHFTAQVFDPSDLLMESVDGQKTFVAPVPLSMPGFTMTTTKPAVSDNYHFNIHSPIYYQDGWTLEVDFDDTMDLSAWDYNTDFNISDNSSLQFPSSGQVTVDNMTNTFSIVLPYNFNNSNGRDINLDLLNLVNPTTTGLKNVTVRLKDPLGNLAGQFTRSYTINDALDIRPQTPLKGNTNSYFFGFTPSTDLENGSNVVLTFPSEFRLTSFSGIYFTGAFDATATNVNVDTMTNTISFTVDSTSASMPTSAGTEVQLRVDYIGSPHDGNAVPYVINLDQYDPSNVFLQNLQGTVYFAPPDPISPSVSLIDNHVDATTTYTTTFTPTVGLDSGWIVRAQFPNDTDLSNVVESTANVRLTGGGLQSSSITKHVAERYIDVHVSCSSCSGGSGNALITLEIDGVKNASTAGSYNLGLDIYDTSDNFINTGTGPYTLIASSGNNAPNAPLNPYAYPSTVAMGDYGNPGPSSMPSTSVVFSAEHDDDEHDAATHYEIEVYDDSSLLVGNLIYSTNKTAFGTPLPEGQRPAYPGIATAATLVDGQTYYWRIRYYDDVNTPGTPGAWSSTASFTVNLPSADTTPPAVTAQTPLNNAINVSPTGTLSYTITDADSNVDVSTVNITVDGVNAIVNGVCQTANFTCGVIPADAPSVTLSVTPNTPLAAGSIAVHITADDTGGPNSMNFNTAFTTPPVVTSQTPTSGATGTPLAPSFSYTIQDRDFLVDASTVNITVDGTPAISGGVCQMGFVCSAAPSVDASSLTYSFTPDGITYTPGQVVNVVVVASDTATTPDTLTYNTSFTVRTNAAPGAPDGLQANGQTNPTNLGTGDVTFSAVHHDTDADPATKYRLEIATDSGFSSIVYDSGAAGTVLPSTANNTRNTPDINPPGTLAPGSYFWRIKFWDDQGAEGAFSSNATFTVLPVDTTPPFISSQTPVNGATNVALTTPFSVTIADADSLVDISTVNITVEGEAAIVNGACQTATFTCTVPGSNASSVTFGFTRNTPVPYTNNQVIDIAVTADDNAATPNHLSTTSSFTMTPPPAPSVPVISFGGSGGGFPSGYVPGQTSPTGNANSNTTSPYQPEGNTNTNTPSRPSAPEQPPINAPIADTCAYFQNQVTNGNYHYEDVSGQLSDYAQYLLDNGIILGRNQTSFGPTDLMTRAEVLRSLVEARCDKFTLMPVTQKPFPDVSVNHPDAIYIDAAKRADIVSGYKDDGTYRPDHFITRAESLKIVVQEVLGSDIRSFDGPSNPFTDVGNTEWYVNYVRFGVAAGLITVPSDRLFHPNEPMSREEITKLLALALQRHDAIAEALGDKLPNSNQNVTPNQNQNTSQTNQNTNAPVHPAPTVDPKDVIREPIQACSYFEARETTHDYKDISNSTLGDFAKQLLDYGVVIGKQQNEFDPHDVVTRSEILRILIQANCKDYVLMPVTQKPFPDVPATHADAVFIQAAKAAKIINGYGDGTYKPDNSISHAEILKILLETALNKIVANFDSTKKMPFTDVDPNAWYARYVRFAAFHDLAVSVDGARFEPNSNGDRGFIAATLLRILKLRDALTGQR